MSDSTATLRDSRTRATRLRRRPRGEPAQGRPRSPRGGQARCADRLPPGAVPQPVLLPDARTTRTSRSPSRSPDRPPRRSAALAAELGVVIVASLFEKRAEGLYHNTAAIIDADGTLSRQVPQDAHPRRPAVLREVLLHARATSASGRGDTRFGRIGVLICWDQWYPGGGAAHRADGAPRSSSIRPRSAGCPPEKAEYGERAAGRLGDDPAEPRHRQRRASSAAVNRVGHEGPERAEAGIEFWGGQLRRRPRRPHPGARRGRTRKSLVVDVRPGARWTWRAPTGRSSATAGSTPTPTSRSDTSIDGETRPLRRDSGYRMPAEWAPHRGTWLSWPHKEASWPGKFAPVPGHLRRDGPPPRRARGGAHQRGRRRRWRPTPARARGGRRGPPGVASSSITIPTNDAWCRDHGPIFVQREPDGRREQAILDWGYNAWGGQVSAVRPRRRHSHRASARSSASRSIHPGIVLEGGSIDVNGAGTLLTTEACLLNPNRNPGSTGAQIEQYLRDYLGVTNILWLGDGIEGDDTDGHVDDLTRFVDARHGGDGGRGRPARTTTTRRSRRTWSGSAG